MAVEERVARLIEAAIIWISLEESKLPRAGYGRSELREIVRRQGAIHPEFLDEDLEQASNLLCNLPRADHSFSPIGTAQIPVTRLSNQSVDFLGLEWLSAIEPLQEYRFDGQWQTQQDIRCGLRSRCFGGLQDRWDFRVVQASNNRCDHHLSGNARF